MKITRFCIIVMIIVSFMLISSNSVICDDYEDTILKRSIEEILDGENELIFSITLIPSNPIENKYRYLDDNEYILGETFHSIEVRVIRSNLNIKPLNMFINFTSPTGRIHPLNTTNLFLNTDYSSIFWLYTGKEGLVFNEPGFWTMDIEFISEDSFNVWELIDNNTCKIYFWNEFPGVDFGNVYHKGIIVYTNSEFLNIKSIDELNQASQSLKDTARYQNESLSSTNWLVYVTFLLVVVTGIYGYITYLHLNESKKNRKREFIEKKIRDFYVPVHRFLVIEKANDIHGNDTNPDLVWITPTDIRDFKELIGNNIYLSSVRLRDLIRQILNSSSTDPINRNIVTEARTLLTNEKNDLIGKLEGITN